MTTIETMRAHMLAQRKHRLWREALALARALTQTRSQSALFFIRLRYGRITTSDSWCEPTAASTISRIKPVLVWLGCSLASIRASNAGDMRIMMQPLWTSDRLAKRGRPRVGLMPSPKPWAVACASWRRKPSVRGLSSSGFGSVSMLANPSP